MLNRLSLNRIGLNRIGLNRIGKPSGGSSDRPYIDPKVLDSLRGVWIMDQNTNESESRNIIKNKIADRGGDLELLNFGYKLNSGYNGYPEDFTSWRNSNHLQVEYSTDGSKFKIISEDNKNWWLITPNNGISNSFKVKVTNCHFPIVWRYTDDGNTYKDIIISEDGIYNLPQSIINNEGVVNRCYFASNTQKNDYTGLTIEQLPLYEGALVTDGKDDMIVSQKTVQEMLGGSKEITVVSMAVNLDSQEMMCNSIYTHTNGYNIRNTLDANKVVSILGYTDNNVNTNNINLIMGDKNSIKIVDRVNYNASYPFYPINYPGFYYKAAIYWTFIANKVLTTDEINQIIAYFKLDKYVTLQVIYDVKRQGLTNDTPAADWYLKDFSGNGHDMQLYNYAKKGNSGIGKYETDFLDSSIWSYKTNSSVTSDKIVCNKAASHIMLLYYTIKDGNKYDVPSFNVLKQGDASEYYYINEQGIRGVFKLLDGINTLPASHGTLFTGTEATCGFGNPGVGNSVTITQIPDYEGALVSDGKDDYGKAEGLPIFKDYTVVTDYCNLSDANAFLFSKNADNNGAFVYNNIATSHSFGQVNNITPNDAERKIHYQSKYVHDGFTINAGSFVDTDKLWLATVRDNDTRFKAAALYSMMLFPYSLSEFLLERQLKKYKLGTLYPDMVEFRPIIKSNSEYQVVDFYIDNLPAVVGKYYPINSALRIAITTQGQVDEVSIKVNGVDFGVPSVNGNRFTFNGTLSDKSPQKINITIDEYIRFEDIVQPYPEIWTITQNGNRVSWGDKLKVGSEFGYNSKVNLLSDVYTTANSYYNGKVVKTGDILKVEKQMTFACDKTWKLNTSEPHAIYSPQKLNIPNSSLKILGYVPDLTGKGNHGKLNNFAYTEDSGVAVDGSIKFDGTDDHITIPTLAHGGKCVMMKVNWSNGGMLYDQRLNSSAYTFGILTSKALPAYNARNNGSTYIDGILNTSIIPIDLSNITHNITAVNDAATDNSTVSPRLGVSVTNATFSNMSLYEFMLFPEIPSEDEIKKLNDVMGIEGGYVESPNYYWDAYGKKNTDTDRNLIADQVSKDVDNALEVKNVAYNSESGYGYGKSNFISIMESSQQFVDIIDDYNFIIKATPHNNNQFFAQVNTPKLIPNNYIRFKVSGIPEDFKMVFGYDYVEGGANEYSHIIDKNGVYSYDSFNVFYTSFRAYTGYTDLTGLNIKVEFLDYHPNGLLLDGVEDRAVNNVIPAVTDFTVIVKREWLDKDSIGNECFIHKGGINTPIGETAFMLEYEIVNDVYYRSSSYGGYINIERTNRPEKIVYQTPTSYNGTTITKGGGTDTIGLTLGAVTNNYWKGVFYKLMLYTKTIDQLSINMLKNLFERDELIDVTNPIFKKQ